MTDRLLARATVLAADGEDRVLLRPLARDACPGCRCGRLSEAEPKALSLAIDPSAARLARGAEVTVSMPARAVLRAAVRLHGLPWISMLAGAGAAAAIGLGDLGCLLGGSAGFGAALLYLRRGAACPVPDVRPAPRP